MFVLPPLPEGYQNSGLQPTMIEFHGWIGESEVHFTDVGWEKLLDEGRWQILIPHPSGSFCCGIGPSRNDAILYALRAYVDIPSRASGGYAERPMFYLH